MKLVDSINGTVSIMMDKHNDGLGWGSKKNQGDENDRFSPFFTLFMESSDNSENASAKMYAKAG